RALDDPADAEPLVFTHRPAFDNLDRVAQPRLVRFIVRLELGPPAHRPPIERVPHPVLDGDDDSLLHFVTGDLALPDLADTPAPGRSGRDRVCHQRFPFPSKGRARARAGAGAG